MVAYLIVINSIKKEGRSNGNNTKRKTDNVPNTANTPKLEYDNAFLFHCIVLLMSISKIQEFYIHFVPKNYCQKCANIFINLKFYIEFY